MAEFAKSINLNVPVETLFSWHEKPGALERLLPPWDKIEVVSRTGNIKNGDEVTLSIPVGPISTQWVARHRDYKVNECFTDEQIKGPFKTWTHRHEFSTVLSQKSQLRDSINYELPLGAVGDLFGSSFVGNNLEQTFRYRHDTLKNDLHHHSISKAPQKILVTGSTGMVGRALIAFLESGGHSVVRMNRNSFGNHALVDGVDAVVHLAGENIAGGRWNDDVKKRLRNSRIETTEFLVDAIAKAKSKPKVFVCASAIGFYGNRGDTELLESDERGDGFLADLCSEWEAVAQRAVVRNIQLRIAMVLTPQGGALQKMLTPFRLGIGGPLGDGSQWMSWIALDDLLYLINHCIHQEDLRGPVNAAAPQSVTNLDFSKTLSGVLGRTMGPRVPAWILRTTAGELADALLLASIRTVPRVAEQSGFTFSQPRLEGALRHLLGKQLA